MNMVFKRIGLGILPLLAFCSACVSLERSYPEIRYFVIAIPDAAERSNADGERILSVANLRVSPRYADKNFVYRISESGYETDFYNQFLIAPDLITTEEVRKGLAAAGIFKYVVGASNQLPANYVLEGSVNALYGDFRNLAAPQAVLEMEFFLHNDNGANPGIIMQKRYMKSIPISGRSPDALVKGWNEALNEILMALATDLKAASS